MKEHYYKIVLPLINKNYFEYEVGDKGKYKYKGTAYILVEKQTKNIAFNTLILDVDQDIYGADDGKYGDDYILKKKPLLFEYRKKSFNYSIPIGRSKNTSKFKGDISEFNDLILKNKLTIKTIDSFISGSHSSGGLKKPEGDPVRIYYENSEDLIAKRYKGNLKSDNNKWKFFSLISSVSGKFNNHSFDDEVTLDYLEQIEEKDINWLFDSCGLKFVPYSGTSFNDLHTPFAEAFASQNVEMFKEPLEAKVSIVAQPDINLNKVDFVEYILSFIDKGDKRYLSKEVRAAWRRIIDEDIKNNHYEKDFVRGVSSFERAHIIENSSATKFLLKDDLSIDDKKDMLKDLFNKNNYILLPGDIHSLWDSKRIYIDMNGDINNIDLSEEEFEIITKNHKNIYSIYGNTINHEREYLLEKRGK